MRHCESNGDFDNELRWQLKEQRCFGFTAELRLEQFSEKLRLCSALFNSSSR